MPDLLSSGVVGLPPDSSVKPGSERRMVVGGRRDKSERLRFL
jgi:hypothetical protein